jgi:ELWxxDGT repeat protein
MKQKLLVLTLLIPIITFGQISEIADINSAGDSSPTDFYVDSNGKLYFRATNGTDGNEPFIYDGSTVSMIKDINTTSFASGSSNPGLFIEFNSLIYFKASDGDEDDGKNETELWQTDGTENGTSLVADINPTASGNPQDFFVYNNELFFEVNDVTSTQIWKLNGGNPVKVTNNNGGAFASPSSPLVFSGGVFIRMSSPNGQNPHVFNGTGDAIELVDATSGTSFGLFNNEVYFEGDDGTVGDELWKTDGTIAGTTFVKDLFVDGTSGNSDPRDFKEFKGELFFAAEDANGYNLWKTDGTSTGTVEVANPNTSGDSSIGNLFSDGTNLYFTASNGTDGKELWIYNGTNASMLKNINTSGDAAIENFILLNSIVYFTADDGTGVKLWMTDGTPSGTVTVASKFTNSVNPTEINNIITRDGKLMFSATGSNGNELFTFDPATLSVASNSLEIVKIFPNPTYNFINVPSKLIDSNYVIYSIIGKEVQKGKITSEKISVVTLSKGNYILKLNSDNTSITRKIIIE